MKRLWLAGIVALALVANSACEQQVKATPRTPFPLKSVEISGQDGQFVADAITARFLEDGAVFKADGVAITGSVDWTTGDGNKVEGIKVNCRGIKIDGLSVSAVTMINSRTYPAMTAVGATTQGTYVHLAAKQVVDDFRRQVLQQQNYLPKETAPAQPLR